MIRMIASIGSIAVVGAALLSATTAHSDGFERAREKGYYEPAPYFTWTGLYFGGSIGGQWSDIDGTYVPSTANHHSSSLDSGIYGGHFGIQQQIGRFVLGFETSVGGGGVFERWNKGRSSPSGSCLIGNPNGICQHHTDYFVTVGPRLGWAVTPGWMIYATGGYASGVLNTRTLVKNTLAEFDFTTGRHDGWFVGAGVEWVLTPNVVVGFEYQHLDFETVRHRPNLAAVAATNIRDMEFSTDILRARLSYKIGRPEPAYDPLK